MIAYRQYVTYGLMLFSMIFLPLGMALASDGQDDMEEPASLIEEIELPEGLSSGLSMEIDATGRVWFVEKVGKQLAVYDPATKKFDAYTLPESWGRCGFFEIHHEPGRGNLVYR